MVDPRLFAGCIFAGKSRLSPLLLCDKILLRREFFLELVVSGYGLCVHPINTTLGYQYRKVLASQAQGGLPDWAAGFRGVLYIFACAVPRALTQSAAR